MIVDSRFMKYKLRIRLKKVKELVNYAEIWLFSKKQAQKLGKDASENLNILKKNFGKSLHCRA